MRVFAFVFAAVCLAGCASEEKPAAQPEPASARDLKFTTGSSGIELYASASGGTLRIENTGGETLSICDDRQCFLLDPGNKMELPVSGKVIFHVSSTGQGEGSAEAHMVGGGDKASVSEQ
jgi:hypothetical protein